ncbi:MAG: DUF3570 domain-containing protein [Myxococcales bacterium]|nr:DUF3570 domain-containing protein [Myxococcales bacterium]
MRRTVELTMVARLASARGGASLRVGLAFALGAATALAASTVARPVVAAESGDSSTQEATKQALRAVTAKKYDDALAALAAAHKQCRRTSCTASVEAEMFLAQGLAFAMKGDDENARVRFEWALVRQRDIEPASGFMTKKVKAAYNAAKTKVEAGRGAQPPMQVGALTSDQKEAIASANKQRDGKDWESCMGTMIGSLSIAGDYAAGKLALARCEDVGGLLIEAQRDANAALEMAKADENDSLIKEAEGYLTDVDNEIPRINLKIPSGVANPEVKIDNSIVAPENVGKPILHNPGKAVVEVRGRRGGQPFFFSKEITFERRETIDVETSSEKTPYQMCLEAARNVAERQKCEKQFLVKEGVSVKAGLEVASYNDDDNTAAMSPSLYFSAVDPTKGWNLGGQAMVDVVTTASADIVATASRRFDELRGGGSLGAGYKLSPVSVGVNGAFSVESDYIGRTVGASISADVFEKMASPYVSYGFGFDIIGRADTVFDIFQRDVQRHTVNAGSSIVFSEHTVGVVGATVEVDLGDTSKPYRHVPMFRSLVAPEIPAGAAADLVALARLPIEPFEKLPDARYRYAGLIGAMHRLETATLRGTERIYKDSWGQLASTTDLRFLWDFYGGAEKDGDATYPQLRLTPHARFHVQSAVDFWQRAYVATQGIGGFILPEFRTGDRELGPLWAATGGVGLRAGLTDVLSLGVQVEATHTRFLDHLYIFQRWGLFSATTMELEWD